MTKEEFFDDLQEIVIGRIIVNEPQIELKNMWAFSMSEQLARVISAEEFTQF